MFVHILKNCPEKGVNSRSIMLATEISHDVLSLTIASFRRLNMTENGFLGSLQIDTHTYGGGRIPCLAQSVCVLCMVEVYGIFVFNFTI